MAYSRSIDQVDATAITDRNQTRVATLTTSGSKTALDVNVIQAPCSPDNVGSSVIGGVVVTFQSSGSYQSGLSASLGISGSGLDFIPTKFYDLESLEQVDGINLSGTNLTSSYGVIMRSGYDQLRFTTSNWVTGTIDAYVRFIPTNPFDDPMYARGNDCFVDTGNSSTTPLSGNSTFTGAWVDTLGFSSIAYSIQTDVTSSSGGVQRQWSQDKTNIINWTGDTLGSDRVGGTQATDLEFRTHARYFRLVYQNGGTAQSYFRLQTILKKSPSSADTIGIAHAPTDGEDAMLTKAILTGKVKRSQDGDSATYRDVNIDAGGALLVTQASTAGAFGSMLVAEETVKANLSFPYAIQTRLVTTGSTNGGAVSWDTGRAKVATSTNTSGSAFLQSQRAVHYTPGQGMIARFTTVYSTGKSGSIQECGLGDANDGFFFMMSGTQFGVCRRRGGVDTFTSQSAWNGDDTFQGSGFTGHTLNPTKGYPYQIQYQWLGYGAIKYFIENPKTGQFVLVHTDRFAGTDTLTSIYNPTLPLRLSVKNTGNNTDIAAYSPSMGVITEGSPNDDVGSNVRFSFNNAVASAGTGGKVAFSIQSKATNIFGGTNTNRINAHLDHIGIRAASTKDMYVTMFLNATITTPSWTDVSTNTSIIQTDTAGTTTGTGGIPIMTWPVAGGTSFVQDLTPYNLILRPGDTISFVVFAEAATVDGRVTIGWHEEN